MEWLNYHHLYYFWIVARQGSVSRAAEELLVSQPTVSAQIKALEQAVGQKLFERAGRGLLLTEAGQLVFAYANDIFTTGRELLRALEHQPAGRPLKLAVGLVDVLPKTVARTLLEPAMQLPQPVRLVCREDKADRLLSDLSAHRLDVVLSDEPIGTAVQFHGFNHLLGECGISFFATADLARKYRPGFPKSLHDAPLLLPSDHTAMRRTLNLWFEARRIRPLVVGEFDDSAMLASFGRAGAGIFPAPAVVEAEIRDEYAVQLVGRAGQIHERFYAITVESRPKHPAVVAVCDAARRQLFSDR